LEGIVLNKLSVIICAYSEKNVDEVLSCIVSVKSQTLQPYEILLVLDPNEELIEFYKSKVNSDVKILVSNGYGLSFARNTGIRNCRGNIIVFIDDDAVADKNWLQNMVKNYDNLDVVGVGGLSRPLWKYKVPKWFPEELYWIIGCSYTGLPVKKAYVRNPIGCNMSFRKEVFEKVGYFRTDIGRIGRKPLGDEETEFSIRVLEKIPNSKIIYDPEVVVQHNVKKNRTSLNYIWYRSFYEGVGKAIIRHRLKNLTSLNTESSFLKYLLTKSIPSRIQRFYRVENICQIMVILISTFAVISGFLTGYLQNIGNRR
jgi:glycosyltransferase involved in cell wall biosynthesis